MQAGPTVRTKKNKNVLENSSICLQMYHYACTLLCTFH